MYTTKLIPILLVLCGCALLSRPKGKVTLIKQWHFSPGYKTTDIEKSNKHPIYTNQKDIFENVSKRLKKNPSSVVIAEGCQGEINSEFSKVYNGWSMAMLSDLKDSELYADIMAPVPMKLKPLFPKTSILCGDDEELINKHLLAFSDLQGFLGFYGRLKSSHGKTFKKYHAALEQLSDKKIPDPLNYTSEMARISWQKVIEYTHARNDVFISQIEKNLSKNPIVIIGGIHVDDMAKKLAKKGIEYEIVTPKGFKNEIGSLMQKVEAILNSNVQGYILYQTPQYLDLKKFPTLNQIDSSKMAGKEEWKELNKLVKRYRIPAEILTSDFDQDGIRDFTLSTNNGKVYITAEDPDWDNDDVPNIIDESIGNVKVTINDQWKFSNHFMLTANDPQPLLMELQQYDIQLTSQFKQSHDVLVMKLFNNVLSVFPEANGKVKVFNATKPIVQYGKNVFFSYIKHTQTMEFYPQNFVNYIKNKRKSFEGVQEEVFILKVVSPIIFHSIAHELAHAIDQRSDEVALANGWSWSSEKVDSKYMQLYRHSRKKLTHIKREKRYRDKDYQQWLSSYQQYHQIRKKQLTSSQVISSPWVTGLKQKDLMHGFLAMEKIASIYSLSKPDEWYAEMVAGCIWQRLFGLKDPITNGVRYELLMGFNPYAPAKSFCESF
jgi:hypothetical protein